MIENKPRKRRRKHSLDRYVIFSLSVLLVYTVVALWLSTKGIENNTLTTCIFATWGGEILSCALIKIYKLKGDSDDGNERNDI